MQEVTTSRAKFPKPLKLYEVLAVFGKNIVVSEGEEWKKYRKIAAPAFSEVRFERCLLPISVAPSPIKAERDPQRNNR